VAAAGVAEEKPVVAVKLLLVFVVLCGRRGAGAA